MSSEPIGEVARLQARRAAVVANLSPAAKHQAFPRLYAQPAPKLSEAQKLRRELHRTQGTLDEVRAENVRLRETVKGLQVELERFSGAAERASKVVPRVATIAAVQRQFLAEYNALSAVDGREPLAHADLIGPRRGYALAHPRQICMWLCVKLCKENSLPRIGRAFGGKDHTTVMHAKRVAAQRMLSRPDLNLIALRVLAHFEVSQ